MATLVMLTGPRAGERLTLDGEQVIGRGEVDIAVEDPKLSRRHAAVRPVPGGVEIEDLGSTNGTAVDGRKLTGPVTLHGGERVKMGDTSFEVAIEVAADRTVMEPVADAGRTVLEPIPAAPEPAPPPAAPPAAVPPAAAPPAAHPPTERHEPAAAPALVASSPAPEPHGATANPFAVPNRESRGSGAQTAHGPAASLLWGPTIVCLIIIIAVAAAEIAYFASRTTP